MPTRRLLLLLLGLAVLWSSPLEAARRRGSGGGAKLVRVPQDAKNLQLAFTRVADGGVIEMAAGTYATPPQGFSFGNARKGFTVRAAAGALVVLDGGGTRQLLRYTNSDRARGKLVTFERLTFHNGFSSAVNRAGGITLTRAEALFRQCVFTDNRAVGPTGGGAVKLLDSSQATFVTSSFRGNSSRMRGGAVSVRGSVAIFQGGELVGNRTNLVGHDTHSHGGAITVLDGALVVTGTRFESNQAAFAGGAIYGFGNWDKGASVLVKSSSFVGNQVLADPCCDITSPTSGGAVHVEDFTTLRIERSLLQRNRAEYGGAIGSYRAVVEIDGSVLLGNQTTLDQTGGGGGAVAALSSDFADSSTGFGAFNRRAAKLVISRSLLQGGGEVVRPPQVGGCLLAGGDESRMYGATGVAPMGTLAENRARVELRGVVLHDCHAGKEAEATGGFGGALSGGLVDLLMEDSMVLASGAHGKGAGGGGGVSLRTDATASFVRTTFAGNGAAAAGGALRVAGSTVDVTGCRFYGNDVVPGAAELLGESRGASIFSLPRDAVPGSSEPARDVSGVVAGSTFAGELGLALAELDKVGPPINALRYDGNRFAPIVFGESVLTNNLAAPAGGGGAMVEQLNSLAVDHGLLGQLRKSLVPNVRVFAPHEGALSVVPSPRSVGASPVAPSVSIVGFAWTGGGAQLGGQPLLQSSGLAEVLPGSYTLTVDGVPAATVVAP